MSKRKGRRLEPILERDILTAEQLAVLEACEEGHVRSWTEAEEEVLRRYYRSRTLPSLVKAWPTLFGHPRTANSIRFHAQGMGLTKTGPL